MSAGGRTLDGDGDGLCVEGGADPELRSWLELRLREACAEAGSSPKRVVIRLVRDEEMAALHRRFSGVEGTTDVLTWVHSDPGAPLEADVAICVDEAARQAAERGHDPARELLLYGVHGLLHAMGHDDRDPADHARMHREEDRILARIGVGPVWSRGEDPA